MSFTQLQVGPQTLSDGATPILRGDKFGAGVLTELNPRYYENVYRKNGYFAAAQAGQSTSGGVATTYVGLCLSNPIGNTFNFAITKVGFMWTVIAAAVNGVGIAVGYSGTTNVVHTTPVTARSSLFGTGPTPTGLVDTSATLPIAPVYHSFISSTPTATTNPTLNGLVDLEGSLVIPPGGYVMTVTTAASAAAAFWPSIQWLELPV